MGMNLAALVELFDSLPADGNRPHMIIADTIKGKGIEWMENSRVWHLGFLAGETHSGLLQISTNINGLHDYA